MLIICLLKCTLTPFSIKDLIIRKIIVRGKANQGIYVLDGHLVHKVHVDDFDLA